MAFLSDALALHLQAIGLATPGTDLWVDYLPDNPDLCLALWETPGNNVDVFCYDSPATAQRVQLLGRGQSTRYAQARKLVYDAYYALARIEPQTFTVTDEDANVVDVRVMSVLFDSVPAVFERDHAERPMFSANATVWFALPSGV